MEEKHPTSQFDPDGRTPDGGYRIKVFRPTWEEMENFSEYMRYIHSVGGHRAGLAKIIPPPNYKPRAAGYDDETLFNMEITSPIRQEVTGEKGLYQQLNLVEKKKMSVRNFKRLSEEKHPTPLYDDVNGDHELDRLFWRNVFTNPSIYGADVPGSLFDEDFKYFNLTKLNTILDDIREDYGVTIQGVNTTYLYFGMWKSSFCWHTEDMDLYSINYLHHGQPKSWYCIAPEYGKRFERLANSFFPHSSRTCRAFLRHKTTMISPQMLKKYSIPFSRCTQYAGEFMVTFPYSYHSGYNHGFNIAEATNFALEYWIDFGKWATRCECSSESVKISMQTFVKRYQADRYDNWLKGRDVCKDPRDQKHIAAAPKPTEYDLYLIGSHERAIEEQAQVEERTRKNALHQNNSSNVKRGPGRPSKRNYDSCALAYERLNEYYIAQTSDEYMIQNDTLPHYHPITPNLQTTQSMNTDVDKSTVTFDSNKPEYERSARKQLKRLRSKQEKLKLKKEKRARDRIISSQELLQFLPLTFTHEKRFNRCIATQPPHCSVCQIFTQHPRDDEDIWGPRLQTTASNDTNSEVDKDSTEVPEAAQQQQVPQPVACASRVDEFKLPRASPVLIPRGLFISNPSIKTDEDKQEKMTEGGDNRNENGIEQSMNESLEDVKFLDLDLESSELIQCVICMLSVHRLCYGLEEMPQSDWICDRCLEPNRSNINCTLCPCRGGAIKPIAGVWSHITCALNVQGVRITDLKKSKSDSSKLSEIKPERNNCVYCSKNLNLNKYVKGLCIPCSASSICGLESCNNTFHPTCGHRNGAKFDSRDLHFDAEVTRPIMAICGDCHEKTQLFEVDDSQPINVDNPEQEFAIGSQVIAFVRDEEKYHPGIIVEKIVRTTYEVYFPELSETESLIDEKRVLNLDQSKEFQLGDQIHVKGYREKTRWGKFKSKQDWNGYSIRFGTRTEKIALQDIYDTVDDLPDEALAKFCVDNGVEKVVKEESSQILGASDNN